MRVRSKKTGISNPNLRKRTEASLTYALSELQKSKVSPYIQHVYLYGSCARHEQTYASDVDILVEFSKNIDSEKYKTDVIALRGRISPVDLELPSVDMHVTIGSEWRENKMLYYQNVKREGIDVWPSVKIPI